MRTVPRPAQVASPKRPHLPPKPAPRHAGPAVAHSRALVPGAQVQRPTARDHVPLAVQAADSANHHASEPAARDPAPIRGPECERHKTTSPAGFPLQEGSTPRRKVNARRSPRPRKDKAAADRTAPSLLARRACGDTVASATAQPFPQTPRSLRRPPSPRSPPAQPKRPHQQPPAPAQLSSRVRRNSSPSYQFGHSPVVASISPSRANRRRSSITPLQSQFGSYSSSGP